MNKPVFSERVWREYQTVTSYLETLTQTIQDLFDEPKDITMLYCHRRDFSTKSLLVEDVISKYSGLPQDIKKVAGRLIETTLALQHLIGLLTEKVRYLLDGFVYSLNSQNNLLLAVSTRSLMEHIGTIAFIYHKTEAFNKKAFNSQNASNFEKLFSSIIQDYSKVFYGTKLSDEIPEFTTLGKNPKPIHVSDVIKKYLCKYYEPAWANYSYLCDFVHPNYHSNLLISSKGLGSSIDPSANVSPYSIHFVKQASDLMVCFEKFIYPLCAFCYQNEVALDKCFHTDTKVNNIFGIIKTQVRGDGKTPDTALNFINGRTTTERLEQFHKYLTDRRITLLTHTVITNDEGKPVAEQDRMITKPTNGRMVWEYKTSEGLMYFENTLD